MSNFQIIVLGIFVFFIIIGVVVFAGLKGSNTQNTPQIVLWGTVSQDLFDRFLNNVNTALGAPLKVTYIQKNAGTFHQDFVEAVAKGQGPDALILPQDLILKEKTYLSVIPFTTISQRTFMDTYIQESELYLTNSGIIAFPFSVDPLVMYWNRDTLTGAGFARYPQNWEEVSMVTQRVTIRDNAANVSKSGVALGEFINVTHAKEILLSLLLQAGNSSSGISQSSGSSALTFYTRFSNPTDALYSWNRAMPQSKNFFISGDLAIYFGFASELPDIRAKNPQLNFDVAPLPQATKATKKVTFGNMLGFAFSRNSPNVSVAYTTLSSLLSPAALLEWTKLTYLPPVRRDMLGARPTDPYLSIMYDSALISRGWLDPSYGQTNTVFQSMIENVVSGKEKVGEAVTRGNNQIGNLTPSN
ncbi:MAG: extracellular solute-binding protein [Candidatus Taylorbacteria bacterium]|nr:extracellular solute-binding protein [Candidatus Taylorbacteria bacterium]